MGTMLFTHQELSFQAMEGYSCAAPSRAVICFSFPCGNGLEVIEKLLRLADLLSPPSFSKHEE